MMSKKEKGARQKVYKGEHGYIKSRKKNQLLFTLLYVLIGCAIFALGMILNQYDAKNIFTMVAILMVLPAAKRIVNFVVFFPFSTVDDELYKKAAAFKQEEDLFFTDVVFTSPDKVMFLAFLVVAGNEVIGLTGDSKQDEVYITNYLKEGLKKRELSHKLIITKDETLFLKRYKGADRAIERDLESEEELAAYLYSLIVE